MNLQVKCKRADGGAPENLPRIQTSRGRLSSSAVAKWLQSSVPARLQLPLEIKVGRGLRRQTPQLLKPTAPCLHEVMSDRVALISLLMQNACPLWLLQL